MKKTAFPFAVCLLFCATLFMAVSCGKPQPDPPSEDVGVARLVTTEYPYEAVYTPYLTDAQGERAPEVGIITSRTELIRFVSMYENSYDFTDSTRSMCYYDAVTQYDEQYFETQSLVVVVLTAKSPSTEYKSEGIGKTDTGYDVRIRASTPASAIPGETDWHIFIEVPNGSLFLLEPENIRVRVVESKSY